MKGNGEMTNIELAELEAKAQIKNLAFVFGVGWFIGFLAGALYIWWRLGFQVPA